MASILQYSILGGKFMTTCIVYMLFGGLAFASSGCHAHMFYEDEVIMPHKVVYTSHTDECWDRWGYYVDGRRIRLRAHTHRVRHVRHHHVRHRHVYKTHRHRGKHHIKKKYHKRHRPTVRKRVVTRHYNKRGKLRKRVVRRHYHKNRY